MVTIALVPGAWHSPEAYGTVMQKLVAAGHECVPISLVSVGADPPVSGMEADTEHIRGILSSLVDQGKHVVCVVHSYGSLPVCNAMPGLSLAERKAAGKKGGVGALVYLAAFVLPPGPTVMQALGGKDLHWFRPETPGVSGGHVGCADPEETFYADLSADEQKKWISKLQSFSYACFFSPTKEAPWQTIPSFYLKCTQDKALLPEVQDGMIASAAGRFDVTEVDSSHSPFLSQPQTCVDIIEKAAKAAA